MKSILYYYSGTGNTRKIVEEIQNVFVSEEIITDLISISNKTVVNIEETDIIGLSFPICAHAFSPFIWKFIKRLPSGKGKSIFVIYTYNDAAAIGGKVIKILKRKGYKVIGVKGVQMPNHLITEAKQIENNEERFLSGVNDAKKFAGNIFKGNEVIDYKNNGSKFVSFMNLYTGLPWLFMRLGFKLVIDHSKCNNCGKCIRECPVQNIKIKKGKIVHNFSCDYCMKCAANCPNKAILINGKDKIKLI